MPRPKSWYILLILGPMMACAAQGPRPLPPSAASGPARESGRLLLPQELCDLRGTLAAETIQQIARFKCEMTETQASLAQSVSSYLSSRDEEPYTATQSRINRMTILTICAKGMTRERAEALVEGVPRSKVLHFGWDKVILANDTEGWIFDMAPSPADRPTQ